jgi:predicted small secreted protein
MKASVIYVLLYNNLINEEKDNLSIVMAGGVAGISRQVLAGGLVIISFDKSKQYSFYVDVLCTGR